ncbi:hypothetical protein [Demequina maris]|uniref:hypothetical protein n=1 Tax=Demequina maris TaxID=1638982 RepID=UPI000784902A|nr:hypothetical protein [Demequina maris]
MTALAGAAVLAPSAAFATDYTSDESTLTCDATTVEVNETFECTIEGPDGSDAALQATTSGEDAAIAGTVTSATKTITDSVTDYSVTAPGTAGTIGLTAIVDGEAVDTATVQVVASSVAGAGTDSELSGTGFENAGLAAGSAVLLVAGAAGVFIGARRRAAQNA